MVNLHILQSYAGACFNSRLTTISVCLFLFRDSHSCLIFKYVFVFVLSSCCLTLVESGSS